MNYFIFNERNSCEWVSHTFGYCAPFVQVVGYPFKTRNSMQHTRIQISICMFFFGREATFAKICKKQMKVSRLLIFLFLDISVNQLFVVNK